MPLSLVVAPLALPDPSDDQIQVGLFDVGLIGGTYQPSTPPHCLTSPCGCMQVVELGGMGPAVHERLHQLNWFIQYFL